jgi:hypothetical protein
MKKLSLILLTICGVATGQAHGINHHSGGSYHASGGRYSHASGGHYSHASGGRYNRGNYYNNGYYNSGYYNNGYYTGGSPFFFGLPFPVPVF